jgi:hypothetical protein
MAVMMIGVFWMMAITGLLFYAIYRMIQKDHLRRVNKATEWEVFDSDDKKQFESTYAANQRV